LNRLGIKSALKGKFYTDYNGELQEGSKNYILKLQETLEISEVFIHILEYELGTKDQNIVEHAKNMVQFIFDNLEKPLIIPTDNYIQ